jgi:hypothetical protein
VSLKEEDVSEWNCTHSVSFCVFSVVEASFWENVPLCKVMEENGDSQIRIYGFAQLSYQIWHCKKHLNGTSLVLLVI